MKRTFVIVLVLACCSCGLQVASIDEGETSETVEGELGAVAPGTPIRVTRSAPLRRDPSRTGVVLASLVVGETGVVIGNGQITSAGFQKVAIRGFRGWVVANRIALNLAEATIDAGPGADAGAALDAGAEVDALDAGAEPGVGSSGPTVVRIIAANLTSGNSQAYEASGSRILQGLRGDVIALQEFNVGDDSPAAVRAWVTSTFGAEFHFVRGTGASTRCATCGIPNGIVSRFPVLASGEWDDVTTGDREFTWARLDVPGVRELFVVSVHLRTAGPDLRNTQALALADFIRRDVGPSDELVIAGDFNLADRSEPCLSTLAPLVTVAGLVGPPVDGRGTSTTNSTRSKPYDHVAVSDTLRAREVPVVIGSSSFPTGFVADTRVHAPLTDLAPAQFADSAASNMQHMAVVRAFSF